MDDTHRNNNRLVLLLIAGIPLTMILAATWLWYFVVHGELDIVGTLGTANRGQLVQPPRQFAEAGLEDGSGARLDFSELEPRWSLVVPNQGASCGESCEHLLYLTRQIHTAMGKEFNRIRRFYVGDTALRETGLDVETLSDDHPLPPAFGAFLEKEHPRLRTLQATPGVFGTLFAEHQAEPDHWYLVDPAGWIMMSYDDSVSYKDVISDLKFLLKNSTN